MSHPKTPEKTGQKFLDELGALIGKHKLTVHQIMDVYSSFMSFMAIRSGDPTDFMERLTDMISFHLDKHWEDGNNKKH